MDINDSSTACFDPSKDAESGDSLQSYCSSMACVAMTANTQPCSAFQRCGSFSGISLACLGADGPLQMEWPAACSESSISITSYLLAPQCLESIVLYIDDCAEACKGISAATTAAPTVTAAASGAAIAASPNVATTATTVGCVANDSGLPRGVGPWKSYCNSNSDLQSEVEVSVAAISRAGYVAAAELAACVDSTVFAQCWPHKCMLVAAAAAAAISASVSAAEVAVGSRWWVRMEGSPLEEGSCSWIDAPGAIMVHKFNH